MTLLLRLGRRWRAGVAVAASLSTAAALSAAAVGAAANAGTTPTTAAILDAGGATAVPGSYIVVFKDAVVARADVATTSQQLASRYGGSTARTYQHALRGFEARMPAAAAARLAADPAVKYVQQNHTFTATGSQSPTPSWGLDRVDQAALPLNSTYNYPNTGAGVRAYIIDTGIRFTHTDFGGRAVSGFDAIDGGTADDCHGHGTHVAGTVGGTAYGVAKDVTLVGVRVLDCTGSGSSAQVIAGVDWVAGDHDPGEPAVANMSLGSSFDQATNDAVTAALADGVTFGVSAGNNTGADACTKSPASTPNAITVAATTSTDARADYSNIGTCVDIFAPGSSITSAWYSGDSSTKTLNGTSMATPHVVGAAALMLVAHPGYTPSQVRDALVADATSSVTNAGTGSPNRLLHTGAIPAPTKDFSLSVTPTSGSVVQGTSVTATVGTATTLGAAQSVTFSAIGLPAGATANFSPATVTSGGSATMTISASASAEPGIYPISVIATGTGATHAVPYLLTLKSSSGCHQINADDVAIIDNGTVNSSVTVTGCAGNPSATSTVKVRIAHTYIGDLLVTLVAPDGSGYVVHNHTGSGADLIDQTYTLNLSSEVANGVWKLRVQDTVAGDTGYIDSWTLNLGAGATPSPSPSPSPTAAPSPTAPPTTCTGSNLADLAIPDNGVVSSSIPIAGCSGNASSTSTVQVHIVHTFIGDLVVTLIAPDGSGFILHNRTGGATQNINQTYTVNLSTEVRNGTWKLQVRDAASGDTGFLDSWTLTL